MLVTNPPRLGLRAGARDQSPTLGRPAGGLETNPFSYRDKTGCARCIGRWLVLETNPPSRAGTGARCIGRGLEQETNPPSRVEGWCWGPIPLIGLAAGARDQSPKVRVEGWC